MVQTDELYLMNPWWRDAKQIHSDRHLVCFEKSVFRYYPKKLFKEIPSDKPGIYTLRGPRQVGKTTFLKLYAKRLIEEGVEPSRIFFLTCDGIKDRFELAETLKVYFQIFGKRSNQIRYLFIDEITTIKDWQSSIKYLVDIGLLDNCLLILSGSSSYDLKSSNERMPGRKGFGKDLIYMPITFQEFLKSLGIEIERKSLREILTFSEEELRTLEARYAFVKEHFVKYLHTGGFPRVIDDFLREGKITEITKNVYRDFILADAEKYLRSRTKLLELLRKLPHIVGQRFSWNSLVDVFSGHIDSVDTIQKYFEYLGYSFIVANIFFVDISRKIVRPKKDKKLYPSDRIVAEIVAEVSGEEIDLPQLIEMLTLRHILRDRDLVHNGLNLYEGPYYWYSERGNEIDFVCEREGVLIPIEVKYQNKITKSDYLGMRKVFGKGLLVTKDTILKDGNIVGLPAWLFFGMLNEE